jgi:hypothetical protein
LRGQPRHHTAFPNTCVWAERLRQNGPERKRQESSSFLKKRTKKLLSVARRYVSNQAEVMATATGKSFLFLFFKKEILPCFASVSVPTRIV